MVPALYSAAHNWCHGPTTYQLQPAYWAYNTVYKVHTAYTTYNTVHKVHKAYTVHTAPTPNTANYRHTETQLGANSSNENSQETKKLSGGLFFCKTVPVLQEFIDTTAL